MSERLSVSRVIDAAPDAIFAVLRDPAGHVAIDSSGMLQDATGSPVSAAGEKFVVHMDRESLGDRPELGKYDVDVVFTVVEPPTRIEWTIESVRLRLGHLYGYELALVDGGTKVTAYYDWSAVEESWKKVFPVISEQALKATLGILARTVKRGYPA